MIPGAIRFPQLPVLVVDDEPSLIRCVTAMLDTGGITHCIPCDDSREVPRLLAEQPFSAVLLDLVMPHVSGEALLPGLVERFPDVPVIVITGTDDVDTAVRCMRLGAFDYMLKPVETQRLISGVRRAIELRELRHEYTVLSQRLLSQTLERPDAFSAILTASPKMLMVFHLAETIAKTQKPVLITGETGVGKELLSRAIHVLSGRAGAFIATNVAGVDDAVFSDTLFGHVRGAYTGADTVRPGLLERAAGGSMFLDEIGELSVAAQVRLLRLVQEREYFPLGSDAPKTTDARFLLATNRNLEAAVAKGEFRADLYYRLNIHHVHIPPLRERPEDLPGLLEHFLSEAAHALGRNKPTPPRELTGLLATYHFPGNVRELEAMVYDAVSRHESGKLSMEVFKRCIGDSRVRQSDSPHGQAEGVRPALVVPDVFPTLKETSEFLIGEALRRSNGNQSIAAELLGITPSALNKRLRRGATQ